jgi:hypothetical protein
MPGARSDQRVVYGSARDAQLGQFREQWRRGRRLQMTRPGKARGEQLGNHGRRTSGRGRQAGQHREALEGGVARQPESPRTYRGRGLFVVHVIRDGERYGDARVDQQIRAAYRAPPSRTIA